MPLTGFSECGLQSTSWGGKRAPETLVGAAVSGVAEVLHTALTSKVRDKV